MGQPGESTQNPPLSPAASPGPLGWGLPHGASDPAAVARDLPARGNGEDAGPGPRDPGVEGENGEVTSAPPSLHTRLCPSGACSLIGQMAEQLLPSLNPTPGLVGMVLRPGT